jgi:FixJ family two-component response regulator
MRKTRTPLIAVVDDDGSVRTSTTNLMLSVGYNAVSFASGEELLDSTHLAEADCIITDLQMPGMTGLRLQDQLQARGHTAPIIFITAFPDERTRNQALARGAAGFFSKPFEVAAILECIHTALNARSGPRPR